MTRTLIAGLLALLGQTNLRAQPSSDSYQRIDGIVAVVGDAERQHLEDNGWCAQQCSFHPAG